MKRWIALAMLLVPFVALAADFWDGNAAMQRGDAEFEGGLNILSNSFPPGTQISILNEDTGKTVTATVTGRIQGQSDILLLLSPKTAEALGVGQGTLGRVRVTEPSKPDAAATQPGDQTMSRDPDLNPAASPASAEPTEVAQTPKPGDEQPAGTDQQSAAPSQGTTPGASAPPAAGNDDSDILSQAESRSPQKEMFQPPREDQKFAYHPEAAPAGTTAEQPPGGVASVSEPGATPPAADQSGLPLADVVAPNESRPQEIVGTGTAVPSPTPAPQTALATPEVTPEGGAQRPVQTDVSGPKPLPPSASASRVALAPPEAPGARSTAPRRGTFFLQLAAYGSEKGARDLAAKLSPTYPALVLAPSSPGGSTYKVVIGPLNKAESGTLLTWFRYRGFPDAFLKQE